MILSYDGSLPGFLCLLGHALKTYPQWSEVRNLAESTLPSLFGQEQEIATDYDFADKVVSGLGKKLGRQFPNKLAHAFSSEWQSIEPDLIKVTGRALKRGRTSLDQLSDPLVHRFQSAAFRTAREKHRLLGLLRFSRLQDNCFLARVEPQANVVPFLGAHFARRFSDQRWVIVDTKRRVALFGAGPKWSLERQVDIAADLNFHDSEAEVVNLWKSFYRHISNPDRYNPQLRRQFMPKRYWSNLTEMQPAEPMK